MALSWNEIKDRALRFTNEWEGESREREQRKIHFGMTSLKYMVLAEDE